MNIVIGPLNDSDNGKSRSCKEKEKIIIKIFLHFLFRKMSTVAVITVISGLTYKRGERVNSARLLAFLNKRILDRRFNCNNSY